MSLLKSKCRLCNDEFFFKHNFHCKTCGELLEPDLCLKCHNKNDRANPNVIYLKSYMRFTLFAFTVFVSYMLIIKGALPS